MYLFQTASDQGTTTGALRELGIEVDTLGQITVDDSLVELTAACRRLHRMHLEFATAIGQVLDRLEQYSQTASQPRSRLAPRPDATPDPTSASVAPTPALRVTCFGHFEVHRADELIAPCHNRNGQTILRYLVAHARHREKSDVLMDVLWPDDSPEVARHKLHCAASALRNSLNGHGSQNRGAGYLVYEDGTYGLSSEATSDVDADRLLAGYTAGQRAGGEEAVAHYRAACVLYSGTFLPDDLYADWSHIRREQVSQAYLSMCSALANHLLRSGKFGEAADWALRILAENRCDEPAYRQLMRACVGQGRRSEAIRLFRRCEGVLETDLGVRPMPETRELFASILRGEAVACSVRHLDPG